MGPESTDDIITIFGIASAPIATISVAFFAYLGNKNNKKQLDIENQQKSLRECEKENEELKEKLDNLNNREDMMLEYIYDMRRRDHEEGRKPLPLPSALNLRN